MNPEQINDLFRQKLRQVRTDLGISQTELGRRLNTTPGFICDFEKGRRIPSITTLAKLANALGVTPATLISSADNEPHAEVPPPKGSKHRKVDA